jgi:hypothetical protein
LEHYILQLTQQSPNGHRGFSLKQTYLCGGV